MTDRRTPAASAQRGPVLVSACLCGTDCTYAAGNEARADLDAALDGFEVVPFCPEVAAGLGVPRPRCEVDPHGRVTTEDGIDVTDAYERGAAEAVALALSSGVRLAVLKHKSPSCGCRGTYDGTHTRTWNPEGRGVAAAALAGAGIECMTEDEAVARFGAGSAGDRDG